MSALMFLRVILLALLSAANFTSGTPNLSQYAQWHLVYLETANAHRVSLGERVIVAIIDTGVSLHPDLKRVLPGKDFLDSHGDGRTDRSGHGTAMAGLVAASGGSPSSALGIAPSAAILPVRVAFGVGVNVSDAVPDGIRWAVENGAKVVCVPAGGEDDSDLRDAISAALAADVVVVASAGNVPEVSAVQFPAAYPGVIAAAGVDRNGNHAAISVRGTETVLAAPAVDITSTDAGGGYRVGTGTSDAAAIIAGAAALVRSKYPNMSATDVVKRLTSTATDKGPPGRDPEYGYGVVNLVAALEAGAESVPPAPGKGEGRHRVGAYVLAAAVTAGLLLAAVHFARRRRWRGYGASASDNPRGGT